MGPERILLCFFTAGLCRMGSVLHGHGPFGEELSERGEEVEKIGLSLGAGAVLRQMILPQVERVFRNSFEAGIFFLLACHAGN